VFPEKDYLLSRRNKGKPNWIGVKNVYGTESKDILQSTLDGGRQLLRR
jgi:hypothetical protein